MLNRLCPYAVQEFTTIGTTFLFLSPGNTGKQLCTTMDKERMRNIDKIILEINECLAYGIIQTISIYMLRL